MIASYVIYAPVLSRRSGEKSLPEVKPTAKWYMKPILTMVNMGTI